jgi:transposase InsO family protein
MSKWTTPRQRRAFYRRYLQGETYQEIADSAGVSKDCVRYWCRRQRDGGDCQTRYQHQSPGLLSRFDPLVRYCILRLRLENPRWGPDSIREHLKKRKSLRGLALPSRASIGRYLHQWPRFRRPQKEKLKSERPKEATEVHQRWQMDFKVEIALDNGTLVTLYTVRDPVGAVCPGAFVFPTGQVGQKGSKVTLERTRSALRTCFARWGTLPDEIQTDGEPALVGKAQDSFPSVFTLWLKGLGIEHLVIRPGRPTDNAQVERCHRTLNDYAIVGHTDADVEELQDILDQAVYELTYELPSRAKGCGGRAPIVAHPELLQPRRPFQPEHELAHFDLRRVDTYLATFTWERKVGKTGQITLGGRHQSYTVGRLYAGQQVMVRFDPTDRHFFFYDPDNPDEEIGRRPARDLDVADLTGLATWPEGLGPQQLPLPLVFSEGVNC